MNETEIIKKYLVPLSKNFKNSFFFKDDGALLQNFLNKEYIISADSFIHGIHCPLDLKPRSSIIRAVLAATSDLSAMGAIPYCMLISISFPRKIKNLEIKEMVKGIKDVSNLTGLKLAGGDLCSYNGPLAYNITVIGKLKKKEILKRSSANVGDLLLFTGAIGEATIGLDCLLKSKNVNHLNLREKKIAIKRFLNPPFLSKFSHASRRHIKACIDISDGLLNDVGKIAEASGCGVRINSELVPSTNIIKKVLLKNNFSLIKLLSAGDDYELAFSINQNKLKIIKKLALKHNIKVTPIGEFIENKGVYLDDKKVDGGYSHF